MDHDPEDEGREPEDEGSVLEEEDPDFENDRREPAASALDRTLRSKSLPTSLPCPFCESADTEQFSPFGGQASTAQYYCNSCRTVFEALRWR